MKVTISTLSFDEYNFEGFAEICKKYGLDGIEIRMGSGIGRLDHTPEELAAAKKLFDDNNLVVAGLGSSVCLRDYNKDLLDNFTQHLPMAKALGAKGIRIFMGTFRNFTYQELLPVDYDGCVKWLKEASDAAAEYGVCVFIETHNDFSTGKILKKLLDDVNKPNCKVIWDVMHPLEVGEIPAETMEHLGDGIAHVHIKDGYLNTDPEVIDYTYCPIGDGDVPIEDCIRILKNSGYEGCMSLEWEEAWRDSLKTLAAPHEEVLKNYGEYMKGILAEI